MRHCLFTALFFVLSFSPLFSQGREEGFPVITDSIPVPILLEKSADAGVRIAVENLQTDFFKVSGGHRPGLYGSPTDKALSQSLKNSGKQGRLIIVATLGRSALLDRLAASGKFDASQLKGAREKYIITTISSPFRGASEALVIAGSDKRGTIYGVYELSKMIGVSPWYYWADVPVAVRPNESIPRTPMTAGEPTVRYRGIFLNDEAPALTGWVKENFGGYNSKFYVKVFELILRLKGNFLWPAMWDAAFYDDDPLNSTLADTYGIIMGTSHHEPLARAQKEWKRYGKGPWNYEENKSVLDSFWRAGVARMKNTEDVLTIGMRGDGDMPMSEDSNIALLENIVANQRRIIAEETASSDKNNNSTAKGASNTANGASGTVNEASRTAKGSSIYANRQFLSDEDVDRLASKVPQVWALYKEVQDYYDKGMKVPDDVTLLFSDDNWGNVRKLPEIGSPKRSGGYGIYYHVDYVGGPRNYKWLNVSQIQRMWEQLNLCYEFGVTQLWVLNVGDLKPMEYPIQFFLDMAWSPATYYPAGLTPRPALDDPQASVVLSSASSTQKQTLVAASSADTYAPKPSSNAESVSKSPEKAHFSATYTPNQPSDAVSVPKSHPATSCQPDKSESTPVASGTTENRTALSSASGTQKLTPTTVLTQDRLFQHTVDFCAATFGPQYAQECARLIDLYSKYSRRVTPELMNEKTFSLKNYDEFTRVTSDFVALREDAFCMYLQLPTEYRASYEQLILFPIQAFSNIYEMYYSVAMNHALYEAKETNCNYWAERVKYHYQTDSLLCWHYNHELVDGKWNHMMDQTHIGYRYWQEPRTNTMPQVYHYPLIASDTLSISMNPFGNFPSAAPRPQGNAAGSPQGNTTAKAASSSSPVATYTPNQPSDAVSVSKSHLATSGQPAKSESTPVASDTQLQSPTFANAATNATANFAVTAATNPSVNPPARPQTNAYKPQGNALAGGFRFRPMPVISYTSATATKSPELLSSIDSLFLSSGKTVSPSYITFEAREFTKAIGNKDVNWVEVPNLGRTESALLLLPAYTVIDSTRTDETYLEYTFTTSSDITSDLTFPVTLYFSPSLNFNSNRGLKYAISLDGAHEQIVNINGTYTTAEMEQWEAQSIIRSSTKHTLKPAERASLQTSATASDSLQPSTHTLRIRFLQTGLVLQKLTIDFGGLKPSYLGPVAVKK